ncbi:MAG: hypothetical protein K6G84_02305 [Lachnospiraceae bacterium]|nr:hypothetical protein [Lachnospiraceae bacterium]
MKEKFYMDYQGNIKENFEKYVNKPGLFKFSDEFYGRMNGNSFWFFKPSPWGKNSFVTIMQGEVQGKKVCFGYRKSSWLLPLTIFIDMIGLALILYSLYLLLIGAGISGDPVESLIFVLIPVIFTVLTFRYPKKEKEELYEQLQKICGHEVNA